MGAIPHGDFSQNKKLTMKISLYSANSPNNFFKKIGYKYYKFYVYLNDFFFRLLPFSKSFFYSSKLNSNNSTGCIEVSSLESNTCKNLIKYIDKLLIENNIKKNYLSSGVYRESITFRLKDSKLKNFLPYKEYINLEKTFLEIKKTIESLGPFTIKPLFIAQKLYAFDKDEGDTNTIMHIDRYVPAIKAFIFLTDTYKQGSSFEFVPKSHIINEKYLEKVLYTSKKHINSKKNIKPFSPQISNALPKKYGSEGQAIISATNGMHRREPFTKTKQFRYTLRFVLYESLSLKKIINGLFIKLISKVVKK